MLHTSVRTDTATRLTAVDALRGFVMVVMALDHVRDFFHAGAMSFSPEDLARTTPILFFTRWITHICAPTFLFLAGLGAYLRLAQTGSKAQLSRFLWTRGLWLIVLELTVMRVAFNFSLSTGYPVLVLVLCALGFSMIALAALIYLPIRVLAIVSLGIVLLHNTLDGIQVGATGASAVVWHLLHQPGVFLLGGVPFVVGYPVLPWIGIMGAGYCIGPVLRADPAARQRTLTRLGLAATAAFVVLRGLNVYGDPQPWSPQDSVVMTIVSFFRATKYPPSLAFALMTLGPALILLARLDRWQPRSDNPLVVIGRVPLFYYVVHFWAIHILASFMAWVRYGSDSFAFLFYPFPSMGGPRELFPEGFGYPLWVAYVVWIAIVVLVYPACRWYARLKARRRAWWMSYV